MLHFLGANTFGDEVGPLLLLEVCEGARPKNRHGDGFGQFGVVAEEMLGPGRRQTAAGERGLEGGDPWPVLDRVDQVGGGRVGEGVDHLVENVVGLGQVNHGGCLRRPEVLEATELGVHAAGE